jgi:UDP-N-acetylmuramyl tripeptide synthase
VCGELQNEDPTRELSDILKEVAKEVKTRFPEKFANAKRAAPPAVEGTSAVAAGKGGKTYQALPPDAKKACDDFLKKGLIKSKDEYLRYYDWG